MIEQAAIDDMETAYKACAKAAKAATAARSGRGRLGRAGRPRGRGGRQSGKQGGRRRGKRAQGEDKDERDEFADSVRLEIAARFLRAWFGILIFLTCLWLVIPPTIRGEPPSPVRLAPLGAADCSRRRRTTTTTQATKRRTAATKTVRPRHRTAPTTSRQR